MLSCPNGTTKDLIDRDRRSDKGKGKSGKGKGKPVNYTGMSAEYHDESYEDHWQQPGASAEEVYHASRSGYEEGWHEAASTQKAALSDPEIKEATEHMQAAVARQAEASRKLLQARAAISTARRDRGFGKGGASWKGRGKRVYLSEYLEEP